MNVARVSIVFTIRGKIACPRAMIALETTAWRNWLESCCAVRSRSCDEWLNNNRGRAFMTSRGCNRMVSLILGTAIAGLAVPAWAFDTPVAIPEPGTMALLLGGAGAAVLVWRNRKK
jgi:hypothetical protein